jgi:hypothetical protein
MGDLVLNGEVSKYLASERREIRMDKQEAIETVIVLLLFLNPNNTLFITDFLGWH